MTLKECEEKLLDLDNRINTMLKEREEILKEWNTCFLNESQDKIICVDEHSGNSHKLFLVNGSSMTQVCDIWDDDLWKEINEYYKVVDNSLRTYSIARGQKGEVSEVEKNLVYAKATEIRQEFLDNKKNKIIDIRESKIEI